MPKHNHYDESYFSNLTPLGLCLRVIGAAIVISLTIVVVGSFGGWFNRGAEVIGPDNVVAQYTLLERDYQSLEGSAINICGLRQARDAATDSNERTQRASQVLATEQNYQRIAADYDRRWANVFEAKLVGPRKLPTTAPTLEAMISQVCPV